MIKHCQIITGNVRSHITGQRFLHLICCAKAGSLKKAAGSGGSEAPAQGEGVAGCFCLTDLLFSGSFTILLETRS